MLLNFLITFMQTTLKDHLRYTLSDCKICSRPMCSSVIVSFYKIQHNQPQINRFNSGSTSHTKKRDGKKRTTNKNTTNRQKQKLQAIHMCNWCAWYSAWRVLKLKHGGYVMSDRMRIPHTFAGEMDLETYNWIKTNRKE